MEVDLSKLSLKSKRVNITMPERLLNSLDYFARKRGETRSGVLTKVATEYMSSHQ
jgi:metal-responsive CopG/Arc/MetJ family transcriptional regulator